MLNDREMIEHWRLRAEYEMAVGICAAAGFMALIFGALALWQAGPWGVWATISAFDLVLAALVFWRIRRVKARLEKLEAFIP